MVKRSRMNGDDCPVARSLDVIGDWWSLLIIRDALDGVRRFGEFQAGLGIAKGMLATRLRALIEHGVLQTGPAADGSAYVQYEVTAKGRDLFPVIVALRQWGENHLYGPDETHSILIDTARHEPVRPLELRSADDRVLAFDETMVRKPAQD